MLDKRIYTWHPTNDEYTTTRAFIFGNYGDSFAKYKSMVEEAKKDFPNLKDEDITLGKVTESIHMKHFVLISFLLPDNTTHPDYRNYTKFDFNY